VIRFSTPADGDAVLAAMYRMWSLNPGNQMAYTDEPKAVDYVVAACAAGRVAIVDETFAIMFDVGCQWYSSSNFLIEECLLRIRRNDTPVAVAIAALDELRAHFNCVMTVVGDTQVGRMTPHYLAAGYRLLGTQLIKD
jgi:hypothetical protein